jgi:hypothetical protein
METSNPFIDIAAMCAFARTLESADTYQGFRATPARVLTNRRIWDAPSSQVLGVSTTRPMPSHVSFPAEAGGLPPRETIPTFFGNRWN